MDTALKVNNKVETHQTKRNASAKKQKDKKDVYTETFVRKLGFLDEYGEALRPVLAASKSGVIRALPNVAYIPATLYMVADVADKYKKGEDGTYQKPSVKMAAREALYQGITSILAPVGVVKGIHKLTKKGVEKIGIFNKPIFNSLSNSVKNTNKNSVIKSFMQKAGMKGKILGAVISIVALSKLMKPIDFATKKLFENVVDPLIGIKKEDS